ncbi:MAG: EAL domain-containing response regulator [Acidobacteria bacterium]|nr:EAL domain-containing response regulator [Acidobacteriota bacterium]
MRAKIILIVDDEPIVAESIAEALEGPGRRIILCGDIDAAACVLERVDVSLVLTDVRMSHPFGYEGLDLVRRISAMHGTTGVVVMTGLRDPELGEFARIHGASMLLQKPFDLSRIERLLADCPDLALPPCLEHAASTIVFPDLETVLRSPSLGPVFQPIVRMSDGSIAAAEALTRYRANRPLNDIGMLLDYAARRKRTTDLDLALIAHSLVAGASFASTLPLFVNVHPTTLGEPDRFIPNLVLRAERAGVRLDSLVLEITEHAALPQHASALESLDALRNAGVRFALDDVGSAYSHLSLIERIQPSYLKISQEFGTGFEESRTHTRIVNNIFQLGQDFGLEVILEGVEASSTAEAARRMGIELAQGYYFARPAPLDELPSLAHVAA